MMKSNQNLVKCSLLLQVNGSKDQFRYTVTPNNEVKIHSDVEEYIFDLDLTKVNIIKINVNHWDTTASNNGASLIIKQIKIGNVIASYLDAISFFKSTVGPIRRTNGYIDSTGTYQIKIHTNLISQNYLNYLLDLTK
jgi:hypothetical protein